MKNIGKLFPIALVLAVLILGSSTALAPSVTTQPTSVTPATDESDSTFTEPSAAFDAKQTTGKAPFNVSFTDKSTGTIFMWNWEFGDGNTSTDQNPTHAYAAAGKYNVTLEVMGMGSDTITKVISVVVSKPAVARESSLCRILYMYIWENCEIYR